MNVPIPCGFAETFENFMLTPVEARSRRFKEMAVNIMNNSSEENKYAYRELECLTLDTALRIQSGQVDDDRLAHIAAIRRLTH